MEMLCDYGPAPVPLFEAINAFHLYKLTSQDIRMLTTQLFTSTADRVSPPSAPCIWRVGALCRAVASALDSRFNPITVEGEISGFSRAASGHCYLTLKDETGQLRCAMFRRSALGLNFVPKDGDHVEVTGSLSVYESRGEMQLVVETMFRAGQGTLLEEFVRLKLRLEQEGLFDTNRKRMPPEMPRCIGIVTSVGAAALHDVSTALQRRTPHIPIIIAPAAVQGVEAPAELIRSLEALYALDMQIDVILLVRGGGAIEDLWAFNNEALCRTIASSPVPVICGVGHETDFTIADFVADLRAPTPTAAAELAAKTNESCLSEVSQCAQQLAKTMANFLDRQSQRADFASERLSRPNALAQHQHLRLTSNLERFNYGVRAVLSAKCLHVEKVLSRLAPSFDKCILQEVQGLDIAQTKLDLLDPKRVLKRGYAWLALENGTTLTASSQVIDGQNVRATLATDTVELAVRRRS